MKKVKAPKRQTGPEPRNGGATSILRDRLARNCRAARDAMELSQAALAARAGISLGMVCQIEQARRSASLETVALLAGALRPAIEDPAELLTEVT